MKGEKQDMAQPAERRSTVRIRSRRHPYPERRRIRRRDYFLLERVGSPFRESYRAFDRLAGPDGSFFLVRSLPTGKKTEQLLSLLSRLKGESFPRALEWEQRRDQIDVVLTWTDGISRADYQSSVSVLLLFELLTIDLPDGGLGGEAGRPELSPQAAGSYPGCCVIHLMRSYCVASRCGRRTAIRITRPGSTTDRNGSPDLASLRNRHRSRASSPGSSNGSWHGVPIASKLETLDSTTCKFTRLRFALNSPHPHTVVVSKRSWAMMLPELRRRPFESMRCDAPL